MSQSAAPASVPTAPAGRTGGPGRLGGSGTVAGTLTSFVGRREDIDRVLGALRAARLVTVTGTGGIGKTRLALQALDIAAPQFVDGGVVVEFAAVRSDRDVALAVAEALDLTTAGADAAEDMLARHLADSELLLVLDNCEHVLDGVRGLVRTLLFATSRLRIVATSREALGIVGEQVLTLHPLDTPAAAPEGPLTVEDAHGYDAVRLFEDRVRAVVDTFALDDANLAAVVGICDRLDGLPLALELAAPRLRVLSPAELLVSLDDRFRVLVRGDPTREPHQRSLDGVVRWSWDLCTPGEQRLWATMSVFAGGADLAAIAAVHGDDAVANAAGHVAAPLPADILDDVDGLVGKSVLSVDTSGPRARYTMLETLLAFGRARLDDTTAAAVADRHARYYLGVAEQGCRGFVTADQAAWARTLAGERANLAAALDHLLLTRADGGRAAVTLAANLRYHWFVSSPRTGAQRIAQAVMALDAPTPDRVVALAFGAFLRVAAGDVAGAVEWAAAARRDAADLDDPVAARRTALVAATVAVFAQAASPLGPEFPAALDATDDAQDLEWQLLPIAGESLCLIVMGRYDDAQAGVERLRARSDRVGESWFHALADSMAAVIAWMQGDLDGATTAGRRGFALHRQFPDLRLAIAMTLQVLAAVAAARGDPDRAARLWGAARRHADGPGAPTWGPAVEARLADLAADLERRMGAGAWKAAVAAGAAADAEELRRLVVDPGQSPPRAGAGRSGRPDTAPLTAREYEVATWVSRGLTNRAIAERLVVSPRTIDGHLERILGKLEFRSRAEVAAWVAARSRPPPAGPTVSAADRG